jgi:hypothetical protein
MASYYINTPLLTCQEGAFPLLTRLNDFRICLPVRFCVVVYNKDRNCLYVHIVYSAESMFLASFIKVSHCLMATYLIVYNAESTLLASFMTVSHCLMATSLMVYNAESTPPCIVYDSEPLFDGYLPDSLYTE